MLRSVCNSLNLRLNYFEQNVLHLLRVLGNQQRPPPSPDLVLLPLHSGIVDSTIPAPSSSAPSTLLDAILWGVPKRRRSREKRMIRKFGVGKMLTVKKLYICDHCGGPYEGGLLCPTCYGRVRDLPEAVAEAARDKFGRSPVDREVLPLYRGETPPPGTDRVIVEVPRPRPSFFCRSLKTPSKPANPDSTVVDVVPQAKVIS